jgi:hypothetical protein
MQTLLKLRKAPGFILGCLLTWLVPFALILACFPEARNAPPSLMAGMLLMSGLSILSILLSVHQSILKPSF